MVRVIRLASFLCLWFQCVCPLMPSRNTYHLTWVSLILDVGYLLMDTLLILEELLLALLHPHSRCFLDLGLLLLAAAPDLGRGVALEKSKGRG